MKAILVASLLFIGSSALAELRLPNSMIAIPTYSKIQLIEKVAIPFLGAVWSDSEGDSNTGEAFCKIGRTSLDGYSEKTIEGNLMITNVKETSTLLQSGHHIYGVSLRISHKYIRSIDCFEYVVIGDQVYSASPSLATFQKIIANKANYPPYVVDYDVIDSLYPRN